MDHTHSQTEKSVTVGALDPVCGMKVDPATAKCKTQHEGKTYFFCCAGCLAKFEANPAKILAAPPKPMAPSLVSLGGIPGIAPASAPVATEDDRTGKIGERAYVCPMCPEVRQEGPGPCPKCGMALEPETVLSATKTEWTCPMHPEIVRTAPGNCPICGMALEPRTVSLGKEENPELRDMTRRLWISTILTAPLLVVAMGSMLSPHSFMPGVWGYRLPWLEFLLATPV